METEQEGIYVKPLTARDGPELQAKLALKGISWPNHRYDHFFKLQGNPVVAFVVGVPPGTIDVFAAPMTRMVIMFERRREGLKEWTRLAW